MWELALLDHAPDPGVELGLLGHLAVVGDEGTHDELSELSLHVRRRHVVDVVILEGEDRLDFLQGKMRRNEVRTGRPQYVEKARMLSPFTRLLVEVI